MPSWRVDISLVAAGDRTLLEVASFFPFEIADFLKPVVSTQSGHRCSPTTHPGIGGGTEDACGGLREDESPEFVLESPRSSVRDAVVGCLNIDVPFVGRVVAGVVVDGAGSAGPVVVTDEFVFVGALTVICLLAVLEDAEDDRSGRRRCDS
jgi:hypothetical protein